MWKTILYFLLVNLAFSIVVVGIYAIGFEYDKANQLHPEFVQVSYDLSIGGVHGQRWLRFLKTMLTIGLIADIAIIFIWYIRSSGRKQSIDSIMKLNMDENLQKLFSAIEAKDEKQVSSALYKCFVSGFSHEYVPALIKLLGKTWHNFHEDIVRALQGLRDPRAVDALYEEAHSEYEYLNYDDCYGLARKCTWALADIGTPEAKAKLQQLAQENNQLVAEFAQKRLDNWERERSRKGTG